MPTESASPNGPQTVVETGPREAIIFIPGIKRSWDDPVIEGIARRMATAIDRHSKTEKATTNVEVAEQEYGAGYKCRMFTIVKKTEEKEKPLIDVFGLDFNDTLVESYSKRTLLMKTVLLAVTLFDSFRRVIFTFNQKGKGFKERVQLVYGLIISGLLIAYLVVLIAAVVASFEALRNLDLSQSRTTTSAQQQPTPAAPVVQSQPDKAGIWSGFKGVIGGIGRRIKSGYEYLKPVFPAIIVSLTALGFVLPPKAKLKENISGAATNYLCLIHYLNWGERSHAISGKLESLIEHLVEREQEYSKIHIVAYSFGSIVAIDNLFPAGRMPIDRFQRIDTLVTIGCPFDMIRTYWPGYFEGRKALTPGGPKWINVYSPIDVLSSNFVDGGNDQSAQEPKTEEVSGNEQPPQKPETEEVGVQVNGKTRKPENLLFTQGPSKSLGVVDILTLTGFKAHSLYWGETVQGEYTCFHDVIKKMYQGTPTLN